MPCVLASLWIFLADRRGGFGDGRVNRDTGRVARVPCASSMPRPGRLGLRRSRSLQRVPMSSNALFSGAAKEHALIVIASPALFIERKRIADLALKHRLPAVVGGREYAEAGGLFSYAVSYPELTSCMRP